MFGSWNCSAMGVLSIALVSAFDVNAQVNRCVGTDGRVEYRSQACDAGASSKALPIGVPATPMLPSASSAGRQPVLTPANVPDQQAIERARIATTPRFGPAVTPVNAAQLQSIPTSPPRDLAANAEVIVVSGYEPSDSTTRVLVHRPGKQVLLVLTSYEKILWRVEASPGTTVKGILVGSYQDKSSVIGDINAKAYMVGLPYAYEAENINFRTLISQLNAWFGVSKMDVFRGQYKLPPTVDVRTPDAPRPQLTLAGVAPEVPASVFKFDLLTSDFRTVAYRNTGPVDALAQGQQLLPGGKVALSRSGGQAYTLSNDRLKVTDRKSDRSVAAPLPANFPEFSWPTDVAYDQDLDIVTVVTLGGEGFLYRYDAKRGQWLDYRSLNNIDITSLAYDADGKRYVAWTSDGDLLSISNRGELLTKKRLLPQLNGFGSTYDVGNASPPRLTLAPRGKQIALLSLDAVGATHIWTFDETTGRVQLTYKRERPAAR
jgi:hypothetical protein